MAATRSTASAAATNTEKQASGNSAFWRTILRFSLLAGASYFTAMSLAHFFSFKYPVLFIYYDVPFYAYQDKIISFCAFLYANLFFEGFRKPEHFAGLCVRSMLTTVVGLSLVNTSGALQEVVGKNSNGGSTALYWAQTAMVASIGLWAAFCKAKAGL